MNKIIGVLLLLIATWGTLVQGSKILYIMPFPATSHYYSQKDLAMSLAERGHEVYVITSFKENSPPKNYHQLMIEKKSFWDQIFGKGMNIFSSQDISFFQFQKYLYQSGYYVTELVFNSTDVQKLLADDHQFDLVISELFFQESLYMFAHKYQAPLVLVSSLGNFFKANYYARNPLQLSTVYHEYGVSYDPESFFGRLSNAIFCLYDWYYLKFVYIPKQEQYALKYLKDLPQPVPSLEEVAANASLVLMNSHFSIDVPTAYMPNFIEVPGLNHKESAKPLPKDLQDILNNAKQGVVFMSMGSNVPVSHMSPEKVQSILKVFGELKQTVLMKWEGHDIENLPSNVITRKWFPQKDVLAHENIKLFIGHGGYLGFQEAVASGVPILGIPVYCDQHINLYRAKQKGYGEILQYKDIDENNFRYLLNKMLTERSYCDNAENIKWIFNDRPMNGLDTAMWWIDYVIRHKGASHMKSPGLKLSFLAYHNLDIIALVLVLLIALIVMFISIYKRVKQIMKRVSRKSGPKKQKTKKN